ncbi:MAG TPA: hypothetical protein VFW19_10585 [Allosphingosinicella sp.]|nr:hypothetical protein [Allosphingosinicella sp.]
MAQPARIGRPGQFDEFRRFCIQRLERSSLVATDRASANALRSLRYAMGGAGLGKLGNALTAGSDLQKGRGVKRVGSEGYRCSGWVVIRGTDSERTVGAIESYTEGSTIVPVKGSWLWIATDRIPRLVGRKRITPGLYVEEGLDATIGKLEFVEGRHSGEGLLVVRNVTDDRFGRPGKLKAIGPRGRIGANRQHVAEAVVFVGIRQTSRNQRVDAQQIIDAEAGNVPVYRQEAMGKP